MTKRKVVLSTAALQDFTSTIEYINARDGIDAPGLVGNLLENAVRSLDELSERGRVVPELERRGISAYRELIAHPYRIVYHVVGREVWVLAIVDGRRDLDELLYERARR